MGHTSEFPFGIYWWTLKNPKNQTFEKTRKKIAGDMILHILQLYEVQFLRYGVRQKIFVILGLFLPFIPPPPPLITQKTKILKKWKKRPEMSSC